MDSVWLGRAASDSEASDALNIPPLTGAVKNQRSDPHAYGTVKKSDWQAKAPARMHAKPFATTWGRRFRLPIQRSLRIFDSHVRERTALDAIKKR